MLAPKGLAAILIKSPLPANCKLLAIRLGWYSGFAGAEGESVCLLSINHVQQQSLSKSDHTEFGESVLKKVADMCPRLYYMRIY